MPVQLPHRGAIADGPHAGNRLQHIRAAVEDVEFLQFGQPAIRLVQIPVVGDLVAVVDDRADHIGIAHRGVAGHKKRRGDVTAFQDGQQPRDASDRPVRLVAHRRHPVSVFAVQPQHRRLGVDIEGEGGSARRTVRPGNGNCRGHGANPTLRAVTEPAG